MLYHLGWNVRRVRYDEWYGVGREAEGIVESDSNTTDSTTESKTPKATNVSSKLESKLRQRLLLRILTEKPQPKLLDKPEESRRDVMRSVGLKRAYYDKRSMKNEKRRVKRRMVVEF